MGRGPSAPPGRLPAASDRANSVAGSAHAWSQKQDPRDGDAPFLPDHSLLSRPADRERHLDVGIFCFTYLAVVRTRALSWS
jgi:hypothetical protein